MKDIGKLLDKEIAKEPDQYHDERYRSHWRISNFGRCYRFQYWYRHGVEVTNPPDAKTLRTFRIGDMFHRDLQSLLPEMACEVDIVVDDVAGHVDHVGDGYIEDFKTVGDFPWRIITKKGYDVVDDKLQYIYQLMAYCYFCEVDVGVLTFIRKDTYEIKSFLFHLEDWADLIEEELKRLRKFWSEEILPSATPRAYRNSKGESQCCRYCLFQSKCDALEGNTAQERAKLSAPIIIDECEIF